LQDITFNFHAQLPDKKSTNMCTASFKNHTGEDRGDSIRYSAWKQLVSALQSTGSDKA